MDPVEGLLEASGLREDARTSAKKHNPPGYHLVESEKETRVVNS